MELEGELGDRTRYHKIAQKKIFFKKKKLEYIRAAALYFLYNDDF